ncbi:hypothetical protein Aple_041420 [Acrocarpospora pleiomorpha]|uniref:DUF3455 domain-containing protein n=1 Tax=Acrocarpospora pleiomorpha TaxID=90975 RepID=A0A5M3XKF2_9ACTN|nr:DUF3455 domain-containing protein [Acrocarpospora pleiomorpha]GES21246.1 hypothetical protein Aple_041420 [Acrocarpospora pleiomorpha]
MKKKLTLALAVTALALGGSATAAASTSNGTPQAANQNNIPDEIKVPAGNKRIAVLKAVGVQIYTCTNGAFTFKQPAANLTDRHGRSKVIHNGGPTWTDLSDGSSVVGAVDKAVPDPKQKAIPQLLLHAASNSGGLDSDLGGVTFIQRLNTRGGLAPTGSCTEGAQLGVRYSADYTFWVKQ